MDFSFYFDPLFKAWDRTLARLLHDGSFKKYALLAVTAWFFDITAVLQLIGTIAMRVYLPSDMAQLRQRLEGFGQELERLADQLLANPENQDVSQALINLLASAVRTYAPYLAMAAGILLVIALIALYVRCRAQWMLLHNAAYDRAEVRAPWSAYSRQANRLFIFLAVLLLAQIVAHLLLLGLCAIVAAILHQTLGQAAGYILGGLLVIVPQFLLFIVFGYIRAFLIGFVLPLMLRFELGLRAGWGYFWQLFRVNAGHFLIFGIVAFMANLALWLVLSVVAGISSLAFLGHGNLLQVPYLGAFVVLPVLYFLRLYSLEFLAQFDDTYALLSDFDDHIDDAYASPPAEND